MATPPAALVAVAAEVARACGRSESSVEALKDIVLKTGSAELKGLWGRLVRGRPAVNLQRAVTLAQLALLVTQSAQRTRAAPLIWVDDRPANNAKEAQDLKDINLDVKQVTSTAEAIAVAGEGAQ